MKDFENAQDSTPNHRVETKWEKPSDPNDATTYWSWYALDDFEIVSDIYTRHNPGEGHLLIRWLLHIQLLMVYCNCVFVDRFSSKSTAYDLELFHYLLLDANIYNFWHTDYKNLIWKLEFEYNLQITLYFFNLFSIAGTSS